MHTQSVAEEDTASSVIPPIQSTMPWRVKAVGPLGGYRLHIRFIDGLEGEVDMAERVRTPGAGVLPRWLTRMCSPRYTLSLGL